MGQTHSSSANNQDQDGDVIMVDDSENNIGDANSLDFNGTTYTSRRVRTQVSRTSSQDRTQFTTSTIEQAPQNGSQRVLRMTPARRRRQQLSSFYSFFPSAATTTQTQTLSRPLNRHQRLHHNTIEDVSFAPRQTDAIAPNLLRRNRTRSSSYNGQETSTNTGITFSSSESTHNTLPTETMFDIRRPRSSSVDAIVNGDLDGDMTRPNVRFSDRLRRSNTHRGSSTRQYSSSISLSSTSSSNSGSSTAGTQTDPFAGSPQRSRRRVTRISARRLFNFGGQDSDSNGSNNNSNNSNSNNNEDEAENHNLGRVLSIAAAATAASLVASQENAVIEAERAANEGHDGSFESFLAALQRRRREASNKSTNQLTTASSSSEEQDPSIDNNNNTAGSQPSQPMSFFRLFRFGGSRSSLTQQNITPETGANVTSSIPNVTSDTNSSNTPHMVPVIIIGIRSVQPRDDSNGNSSSSSQNVDSSTNLESRSNSSRSSRTRSSSTSSRASIRSTASTATQTPPARSWIIYVLGGTYPSTHPILTTPSLFSDNPTYEDMMLLSSLIGPARPPTTTQSEIDANLPIALYNESIVTDLLGNAEKCQVCLCDYIADEEIRVLNCRHGFHKECIDKWLTEGSNKCPICRGVGVPPRESETNNSGPIPTTSAGLDSMGPFF